MKKSDVFKTIIKIQEYCNKQKSCEDCDFGCIDEWDECVCFLKGLPMDWLTSEIPLNVLEGEQEDK